MNSFSQNTSEALNAESCVSANIETGDFILEAKDIRKTFKSPDGSFIEVLRGANMQIARGKSFSLSGESGAGKTTFLNILAGMESPTGGEIFWNSKRIDALSNSAQAKLRGNFMGFVFQNYCLVPELNAIQNVELAARISGNFNALSRKKAQELLESVGLKDRLKHMPTQLSGGERQRLAIARALLNNPAVLLADEPTGNLDEDTAEVVMDILFKMCSQQNAALLLITHNPEFAARTNFSLKLSKGEIFEK